MRPEPTAPIEVHIIGRNSIDILRARDISETGLSVYVPHRFEGCDIHSEVELVVTLPRGQAFSARGAIRHHTEQGDASPFFGVEFTKIAKQHIERIRAYVSDRLGSDA